MEQNKDQQQVRPGTEQNNDQQQQEPASPIPPTDPRKEKLIEENRDLDEEAHRQLEREG